MTSTPTQKNKILCYSSFLQGEIMKRWRHIQYKLCTKQAICREDSAHVCFSVTSVNSLTCARVLSGRSGLSYWEVDQQNQQDARQQQLEAAQGSHGVLTLRLTGKSVQENKTADREKNHFSSLQPETKKIVKFPNGAAIDALLAIL